MDTDMMEMFRQTYLEESFEGLQAMEANLLDLPNGTPDVDVVNTIFRAAHSMKGGAGTFGFSTLIGFTHVLETLLDEIRSGKRDVTEEAKTLMLESVDILRDMLAAERDGQTYDQTASDVVLHKLEALLGNAPTIQPQKTEEVVAGTDYDIQMIPDVDMRASGNCPDRTLKELEALVLNAGAEMLVTTTAKILETPVDMDSRPCLEDYAIHIQGGQVALSDIQEVFEWIDGTYAKITITEIPRDVVTPVVAPLVDANLQPSMEVISDVTATVKPDTSKKPATESEQSIRVAIPKIDHIVNLVGEMVIAQSMVNQFGVLADAANLPWADRLKEGLAELERHTRELQESVMGIRMLPISFAFNRMPRIVHDTSAKLNKKIELVMEGEGTEVDKTVLEKLTDPLVHIIRNSVDHGIEKADIRLSRGKPETGRVTLSAFHQSGKIVIRITDDGGGINLDKVKAKAIAVGVIAENQSMTEKEIVDLIFHPGFSTADQITDVSGRGVGMDVVRRNIRELGGTIEVETFAEKGSRFTIRLPLTMAILDGQLSSVDSQVFVFPLASIVESLQPEIHSIKSVAGTELYRLRDSYIPILRLHDHFSITNGQREMTKALLVVVEHAAHRFGVLVDDLAGQQQVVVKSLELNYKKIEGVSGATILGDGRVALILELSELASFLDFGVSV